MPRPKSQLHKTKGLAITRIDGKCVYLGKHGSTESRARFSHLLSQWELTGKPAEVDALTVGRLLLESAPGNSLDRLWRRIHCRSKAYCLPISNMPIRTIAKMVGTRPNIIW